MNDNIRDGGGIAISLIQEDQRAVCGDVEQSHALSMAQTRTLTWSHIRNAREGLCD